MKLTLIKPALGPIIIFTLIVVMYKLSLSFFGGRANTPYLFSAIYYGFLAFSAYKLANNPPNFSIIDAMEVIKEKWFLLLLTLVPFFLMIGTIIGLKYWCDIIDVPVMYSHFPELIQKKGLAEVVIIFIIAPIVEELFFRHFIYGEFARKGNYILGAIYSSLLFSIVPMAIWQFLGLLIFGLFQCYVYSKSNKKIFFPVISNMIFTFCIFCLPVI